jgi:hypothetical protein
MNKEELQKAYEKAQFSLDEITKTKETYLKEVQVLEEESLIYSDLVRKLELDILAHTLIEEVPKQ